MTNADRLAALAQHRLAFKDVGQDGVPRYERRPDGDLYFVEQVEQMFTANLGEERQMEHLTPTENNAIRHSAAGNLAFLLSVIRSGEQLDPAEEAVIQRTIFELEHESRSPDGDGQERSTADLRPSENPTGRRDVAGARSQSRQQEVDVLTAGSADGSEPSDSHQPANGAIPMIVLTRIDRSTGSNLILDLETGAVLYETPSYGLAEAIRHVLMNADAREAAPAHVAAWVIRHDPRKLFVMQPVVSSNLFAIGWRDETLRVQFKNGAMYQYAHVPREIFEAISGAPSPGSVFDEVIKSDPVGHPFTNIAEAGVVL